MNLTLMRLLVDVSIRSSALAILVAVLLGMLRVRSSTIRHRAWAAVLCTMLVLPVLSYGMQSLTLAVQVPISFAVLDRPINQEAAGQVVSARDERPAEVPRGSQIAPPLPSVPVPAAPLPIRNSDDLGAWLLSGMVVYSTGVLFLLGRSWAGWRTAQRIVAKGQIVHVTSDGGISKDVFTIRESTAVRTPVTLGVVQPTILLPSDWKTWRLDVLRAVLAHEAAHVSRRDSLILLLARINCCLFWFHPLTWWLERTLALEAEHACDQVAVRTVDAPERYAEILLEMAEVVRSRGRLVWRAAGINGGGALGQRINRILDGDFSSELSRLHKGVLTTACAVTIVVVAACQPESTAFRLKTDAALEQRDRRLRGDLQQIERAVMRDFAGADREVSPQRIEALETSATVRPEDLDALRELLLAYWIAPAIEPRRFHILQLIERHPESPLAGSIEARIFPEPIYPYSLTGTSAGEHIGSPVFPADPTGYELARAVWLSQTTRPGVSTAVLGNAASFFEGIDNALTEELLIRARRLDPQGPWTAHLGRFYTIVLVGSRVPGPKALREESRPGSNTPFGVGVRKKLGESNDDELLTAAGWFLARAIRTPLMSFDPRVWAESCFKRALQVRPQAVLAHSELLRVRAAQMDHRGRELWEVPPAGQYASVAAMPEADRFEELPELMRDAYDSLESIARLDDPNLRDRLDIARQQTIQYAHDALTLAPRFRTHRRYATVLYTANMTLAALALHDGDEQTAVAFLQKAARAPASEELAYTDNLLSRPYRSLPVNLIQRGQHDVVTAFLERMAELNVARRGEFREAAAAIRRGDKPEL